MFPTMVNGIALNKIKNVRLRSLTLNLRAENFVLVLMFKVIDDVDCVSQRICKFDPYTAVSSKQRKAGN